MVEVSKRAREAERPFHAIARIIDPSAWDRHDEILLNLEYENASGKMLHRASADSLIAPSLTKARAILSLADTKTETAMLREALERLLDSADAFREAAEWHLSDSDFELDFALAESHAKLSVTAIPNARSALTGSKSA